MTSAQLPGLLGSLAIIAVSFAVTLHTVRDRKAEVLRALGIAPAAPTKPETPSAVVSERDGANGEGVRG